MPNHTNPPMVLNFNGGGIRGYTSLCIFDELEKKIKGKLDARNLNDIYSEDFKPCEHFDMICGVSTGAIIALMLGRLGMTIKDCKKAYEELVKIVFGDQKFIVYCRAFRTYATSSFRIRRKIVAGFYRYRSEVLERAIGDYLDTHGWGPNEPLIPSVNHPTQCRVLIPVIMVERQPRTNTDTDTLRMLCTHPEDNDIGDKWTILQAIMAATAAPTYFQPYTHPSGEVYIDAAFRGHNNPCELAYERMKNLTGHRKEALFLDIGTGTHHRTLHLFSFWRNLKITFRMGCSQITDTTIPSNRVEGYCNRGNSEKTYYYLNVEYPKPIRCHHYNELENIKDYASKYAQEQAPLLDEIAQRIFDVMSKEYYRKGSPREMQDRYHDPCNRAASSSVCFFNAENDRFFRGCCVPADWMPYTSLHMLNAFVKFKKANVIIEMAYAQGYHFDKSQLEMAIANLYDVLEEQRQAFKLARESPTLLSEFTLTALKLSAAYDLADQTEVFNEKRDAIKDWIALMEGRQSCYPGFKSPCEWFSIKKRQQYRDNIPDM